MRRLILLLMLPLLACNGSDTPPSSTETVVPVTQTAVPPTTIPDTPIPTSIPSTDTPSSVSTFPDPNAYSWQQVASGLDRPLDLQPDGSGRLYIVEKLGHIHLFQDAEDGQVSETPFLNIEDRVNDISNEMGLLGLAFHPNYAENGFFYVNYTGSGGNTFISRFHAEGDTVDPNSEVILLTVDQPFPNHNGGVVTFGPDGYLYLGLGDGGAAGDPFGNGQSLDTLLGKILRIDVDSAEPYAIPPDNPFGDEIWAYGLRNPWRISFDRNTDDLYIGDVGQGEWEEIDFLPAGAPGGANFGWDLREGAHDYEGGGSADLIEPIAEYSHQEGGCSVTGGYVYRGSMPEWNGIYLYGDYCTGLIWGLIRSGDSWQKQLLFQVNQRITSFGQDESGEIYLIGDGGEILRLTRN
ncbi:MAG TPA: PQQ-dependent sugar dehydrogenase [Anaerolineales bacterium]|jgi:glucose/arabinose dehydrogenase|nr:PQQ-dependent sugar dehydrogenase [Anaerolineales bacterium]